MPIAYPSPSPPAAMTVSAGLASFTPIAWARRRPCSAWIPLISRKLWIEPEQPIPPTSTRSWVATFISSAAFLRAARTPKSPQPGHQMGGTGFADSTILRTSLDPRYDLGGPEIRAIELGERPQLRMVPGHRLSEE